MKPTCRELLDRCYQEAGEGPVQQSGALLAARVERVLALHQKVYDMGDDRYFCEADESDWPCLTMQLLDVEK